MSRPIQFLSGIALATVVGCAAEVSPLSEALFDAPLARNDLHRISEAQRQAAEPGCEGLAAADQRLVGVEGQPSLGALLDLDGGVVCVDAWSLLRDELRVLADPFAADPSPQPSRPGDRWVGSMTQAPQEDATSLGDT